MDIKIRDLTMVYGETTAVDALDLDVHAGEMLVLLGPSGCGKTTTMRCIAGLERPAAGSIRIGDRTVYDAASGASLPPHQRQVGMVFQSYAIWPHMSVFDNVAFPLKMQRVSRADIGERVAQVLDIVGLSGYERRGASKLSGGQMQRVAVARSVVMRPKVLLFDEPLSNLDAKLRDKLRFELRELQQRLGLTAVYVTHDQSEAMALADRIVVMRSGKIVQVDEPISLYQQPNSPFVADFLGVDNIYEGHAVGEDRIKLPGGLIVEAEHEADSGDDVHLWVRADHVEVLPEHPPDVSNTWPAEVKAYSFLGTQVRYHLEITDGPRIYASSGVTGRPFQRGTQVFVHAPRERIQVQMRADRQTS